MSDDRERLFRVLDNIKNLADEEPDLISSFQGALESALSVLQSDDAFGTECQLDPRGDFRNGSWSMWCVEGIDDGSEEALPYEDEE